MWCDLKIIELENTRWTISVRCRFAVAAYAATNLSLALWTVCLFERFRLNSFNTIGVIHVWKWKYKFYNLLINYDIFFFLLWNSFVPYEFLVAATIESYQKLVIWRSVPDTKCYTATFRVRHNRLNAILGAIWFIKPHCWGLFQHQKLVRNYSIAIYTGQFVHLAPTERNASVYL